MRDSGNDYDALFWRDRQAGPRSRSPQQVSDRCVFMWLCALWIYEEINFLVSIN